MEKITPEQFLKESGKDDGAILKGLNNILGKSDISGDDDELTQEQIGEILKSSVPFGADNSNDPKPQEPEPQDPADISIEEEPAKDEDVAAPIETVKPLEPAESEEPVKPAEPKENLDLEKMKQEVDGARRKYIEKDYEADAKAGLIYRILKLGKRNLGEFSKEIDGVKENYENVLKKYKDAMIEDAVSGGGDFENVIRYFQITESLNLRIGREDLKMEKHPNWEKWKGVAVGSINKYRELCSLPGKKISGWLEKYGYGGKWVGLGAGAVITSSLLAQAGMRGASLPAAVFGGIVSTVGYKKMLETVAESSRMKKDEKEVKKAQKEMEEGNFAIAERVAKLNGILDKKIGALDERVQKEKAWKRYRTFGAIALGGATVFGGRWLGEKLAHAPNAYQNYKMNKEMEELAVNKLLHGIDNPKAGGVYQMAMEYAEKTGVRPKNLEQHLQHLTQHDTTVIPEAGVDKGYVVLDEGNPKLDITPDNSSAPAVPDNVLVSAHANHGHMPASVSEVSKNIIDINIKKGDSIEGNIIEKLRAMKMGKNEAGKLAHHMTLQYAEDNKISFDKLNHIQPGDHLEFKINPKHLEDSKIINFERTSGIPAPDISHTGGAHQAAEIHNGQTGDLHENPAADVKNVKADITPVEDFGLGTSAGAENNSAGVESASLEIDHNADMVMIDGISGTVGELKNVSEIGFNIPKDYEAIKKINMLKFLEEMGKVERINAGGGSVVYPNLPHTGFFNQSYVEQGKLASVFKNAIAKGILSAKENISVSEALRKIKPEDIESLLKMKK